MEKALVKDLAGIPRADTLWNSILDNMIEQTSREVELYTDRVYTKDGTPS